MKSKATLILSVCMVAATAGSQAQAKAFYTAAPADSGCAQYDVSDIINSIDKNKNGKMTHEEWVEAAAPESSYKMFDRDKRGYVTVQEFLAASPPPRIDANHDCKITLAEMKAMEKKLPVIKPLDQSPAFYALDTNHDGKVSAKEWAVLGPSGTMFRDMDTKHQGYLTLDEMNASHPPVWVDANHDGKLEFSELQHAIKKNYQAPHQNGSGS